MNTMSFRARDLESFSYNKGPFSIGRGKNRWENGLELKNMKYKPEGIE